MEQRGLSLILRLALLILVSSAVTTTAVVPKVNLTAVFDHRLVQLLRQTTSGLSIKQKSERELKTILSELELQDAKLGDSCSRKMWAEYMQPIYEALLQGTFVAQKSKNDDFAVAILKDKSVMTKVCMSSTEVLECNVKGKCDCLSFLPTEFQAEFPCDETETTRTESVLGSFLGNPFFMWAREVFGGGVSGAPPTAGISVAIIAISSLISLIL